MSYAHSYDSAIAAMETRCYTSTKSSEVRIYRSPEILATVRLEETLLCIVLLFLFLFFCGNVTDFIGFLWLWCAEVSNNALNGVQNMISQLFRYIVTQLLLFIDSIIACNAR